MIQGINLTARDYLGIRQGVEIWKEQLSCTKRTMLPTLNDFGRIFLSCVKSEKTTGLTASDYLLRPVLSKSGGIIKCLRPDFEIDLRNMGYSLQKLSEATRPQASKKQDRTKKEVPKDKSVLKEIERSINKAAGKYDLAPNLIRGVIQAESNFQVRVESSAGALGLMQLMPATAKELGVKNPYDIDQNIDGGTRYLKNMLDRFGGDLRKALSAYNAGPGTVERYGGDVPYQETRQYVDRVIGFSGLKV